MGGDTSEADAHELRAESFQPRLGLTNASAYALQPPLRSGFRAQLRLGVRPQRKSVRPLQYVCCLDTEHTP
jgi:hypothetical protein